MFKIPCEVILCSIILYYVKNYQATLTILDHGADVNLRFGQKKRTVMHHICASSFLEYEEIKHSGRKSIEDVIGIRW
eukprot:UN21873